MALSVLDDKLKRPEEGGLAGSPGKSIGLWDAIHAYLADCYPGVKNQWQFTSPRYGWILRARHKKRTILYMTPGRGVRVEVRRRTDMDTAKKLVEIKMAN